MQNLKLNDKINLLRDLFTNKHISKQDICMLMGIDDFNFSKLFGNEEDGQKLTAVLVCGGAGFIGSNFVRHMVENYPDIKIVNYDKLTYAGNLDNLLSICNKKNYSFVQGDVIDLELLNKVMSENKISHVINFAAETHVDRSIHGGCKDFVLSNTLGVQMILDAVRANGIKKFVNVSTDEVYGALELDDPSKFTENTPIMPNMPYAAAKAGGDLMCNAYFKTHKVPVIVTHCSNNYGPYQFPEKLIPYFVFRLLENKKVPVYGDGLNVRDWIQVKDHCRALELLLRKGEPGRVYNIGSDNERSNMEVTQMILKIMGKSQDSIEYVTDRPGHDRRYAIDASKIFELGWKPEYPREKFEQGLRKTVEWYITNRAWVEKLWKKKEEMNDWQKNYCVRTDTPQKRAS
jgi:dTDP-glucose 4,6-dehydratase